MSEQQVIVLSFTRTVILIVLSFNPLKPPKKRLDALTWW
jgi:hypothetical protein